MYTDGWLELSRRLLTSLRGTPGTDVVLVSSSQVGHLRRACRTNKETGLERYVAREGRAGTASSCTHWQIVPVLAKLLLFGLAEHFPVGSVYSSATKCGFAVP